MISGIILKRVTGSLWLRGLRPFRSVMGAAISYAVMGIKRIYFLVKMCMKIRFSLIGRDWEIGRSRGRS